MFVLLLFLTVGQYEPDLVPFLKGCVKTSPGLRVMDSSVPHTEERTSSSTSLSEFNHMFITKSK